MHIDKNNLANLTGLWKKYGSKPMNVDRFPKWHINTRWPYRCWPDEIIDEVNPAIRDYSNDITWLDTTPESTIVPVWPKIDSKRPGDISSFEWPVIEKQLLEKNWRCTFEQMAMYLALNQHEAYSAPTRPGFKVMPMSKPDDLKKWIDIGSHAFGYTIDSKVIANVINNEDIRVLLAWQDDQAVAAALLYKTDDFIGIHQVGVTPEFQGLGIAKCLMQHLIEISALWQGKYLVLQASQSGLPLYERLGFKPQFSIKNYQRVL